jgi:transposase-like protein
VGQAQRRYGIAGATTVAKWVRRLGKNHLLAKVVRVEQPQEQTELERLRRQVRDLEHALAQTRMKELLAEAHFDLVCQKQGIDPATEKKKVDAELSRRRSAGPSRATKG